MSEGVEMLLGRTLSRVVAQTNRYDEDEILFEDENGSQFKMYHKPECCETVRLEEVIGDLQDLVGASIARAECVTNRDDPPNKYADSWTWTFYKLATIKGEVVMRWLGESNGYYSEEVSVRMVRASHADRMAHAMGVIQLPWELLEND